MIEVIWSLLLMQRSRRGLWMRLFSCPTLPRKSGMGSIDTVCLSFLMDLLCCATEADVRLGVPRRFLQKADHQFRGCLRIHVSPLLLSLSARFHNDS